STTSKPSWSSPPSPTPAPAGAPTATRCSPTLPPRPPASTPVPPAKKSPTCSPRRPATRRPHDRRHLMESLSLLRRIPRPPDPDDDGTPQLLTTEELADLLRVDPSTIRRWRTSHPRLGPPFIHISDRVTKYDLDDVRRWLAQRRVDPEAA